MSDPENLGFRYSGKQGDFGKKMLKIRMQRYIFHPISELLTPVIFECIKNLAISFIKDRKRLKALKWYPFSLVIYLHPKIRP